MPIHSDEFEFDMAGWLCEKSSKALRDVCRLADWLHSNASGLSQEQHEILEYELRGALRYLAIVVAFARERTDALSDAWSAALYHHGEDAVEPFLAALSAPRGERVPPPNYPRPIDDALRLLEEIDRGLRAQDPVLSLVRSQLSQLADLLGVGKLGELRSQGADLIQLINRQAVDHEIPWSEFAEAVLALLTDIRSRCIALGECYRWSA